MLDWAKANREIFVNTFENLSDTDHEFIRAVETTTKSIDSTRTRFERWLSAIGKVSDIKIALPNIKAQ